MKRIKSRRDRLCADKRVKWFIGIFFLVICFSQAISVKAGMNDSVIVKNRVEGVYAIATVGSQRHLYYLNMYEMNGIVSYCIDIGVDITTDIYHSTNDFAISYLTPGQIEYIREVSYFGYRYEGHDDYHYYMAAQEILWEYLTNGSADVEWTNVLDVNGDRINIDSYKNEILRLMFRYTQRPSFEWIDGSILNLGQEVVLEDLGQVLVDYEIVSSGHTMAEIDGNYLKFKVSDQYVGRDSIVIKKKEYYSYDSLLYYYDTSQRLISNGNFNPYRKEIYFNVRGARLNVQIVDRETGLNVPQGQASLVGAVYELYNQDGILLGSYETDDDGRFEVDNLPYGHYFVKHILPSEGYLLNEEIVAFDISENEMELKLEEQVISNVIEIMKVYGKDGGKYSSEEGVSFSIYDIYGQVYDTAITGIDGFLTVRLPYGNYIVHQNNTSFGYTMVDDFEVRVQEYLEEVVHYSLINNLIECVVKVNTRDLDTKVTIPSEEFSYRVRKKDEDVYLEVDGQSVFTTILDGTLVFPMLFSYGDYVLEQVTSGIGYVLNEEFVEFSLNDYTNFDLLNGQLVVSVDIYNQKVLGRVNILAQQEEFVALDHDYYYQNILREGSSFVLVADEDIVADGIIVYQKGEEIYRVITGSDGRISISNLYLGHYCIVDEEGEQMDCFHLDSSNSFEKIVEKNLEFTIYLEKGNVIIKNTSEFGDDIKDSVFEVYDTNQQIIYAGVTNEEGWVKILDLPFGDYCIHQKSVPDGYLIQEDDICISLNGDRQVSFLNTVISKQWIAVPNTFQDKSNYFKLFCLFVIGIGVICYKKILFSRS